MSGVFLSSPAGMCSIEVTFFVGSSMSSFTASVPRCCVLQLDACAAIVVCWWVIRELHSSGLRCLFWVHSCVREASAIRMYWRHISNDNHLQVLANRSGMPCCCPCSSVQSSTAAQAIAPASNRTFRHQAPAVFTHLLQSCHVTVTQASELATRWPQSARQLRQAACAELYTTLPA